MTKKTILDQKRVGNIIEVFDDAFAKIIQDNAKELDIVLQNLKLLNYQVFLMKRLKLTTSAVFHCLGYLPWQFSFLGRLCFSLFHLVMITWWGIFSV